MIAQIGRLRICTYELIYELRYIRTNGREIFSRAWARIEFMDTKNVEVSYDLRDEYVCMYVYPDMYVHIRSTTMSDYFLNV